MEDDSDDDDESDESSESESDNEDVDQSDAGFVEPPDASTIPSAHVAEETERPIVTGKGGGKAGGLAQKRCCILGVSPQGTVMQCTNEAKRAVDITQGRWCLTPNAATKVCESHYNRGRKLYKALPSAHHWQPPREPVRRVLSSFFLSSFFLSLNLLFSVSYLLSCLLFNILLSVHYSHPSKLLNVSHHLLIHYFLSIYHLHRMEKRKGNRSQQLPPSNVLVATATSPFRLGRRLSGR